MGVPLWQGAPDHSPLNRFHAWLSAQHPRALFDDVLAFLDQVDPEADGSTQWLDTFALASPAAPTGMVGVLLGLLAQLLDHWRACASAEAVADLPMLDEPTWRHPPPARTPAQRLRRRRETVALVPSVSATITRHLDQLPPTDARPIQVWLDLLAKVLADETTSDADGQVIERPR